MLCISNLSSFSVAELFYRCTELVWVRWKWHYPPENTSFSKWYLQSFMRERHYFLYKEDRSIHDLIYYLNAPNLRLLCSQNNRKAQSILTVQSKRKLSQELSFPSASSLRQSVVLNVGQKFWFCRLEMSGCTKTCLGSEINYHTPC